MLHTYSGEEDSYPVLIDFGLAKHYDNKGKPTSTVRLQGCSDGYSPMEQYVRINEFSPFADVYALAATLFFMLTGKDPVIASEISKDYIVESLPELISERTRNAIVAAMRKDKTERTQTIRQFLDNLDAPYTLPFGYKLETKNGVFLITSVVSTSTDRIVYSARKASGKTANVVQGNLTQTAEYRVTEFFSKEFCQRSNNGDVRMEGKTDEAINKFKTDVLAECGLASWGTSKQNSKGDFLCETCDANGTLYSIRTASKSPVYKKYVWYAAALLCLILGFMLPKIFGGDSNGEDMNLLTDNVKDTVFYEEVVVEADSAAIQRDEKERLYKEYLAKAENCCDQAEKRSGQNSAIQILLDAKYYYYDCAKKLHQELYGTAFESNSRIDSLVSNEFNYWVAQGDNVAKGRKYYATKKTYYERAYKLRNSQTIKARIDWLEAQLNTKRRR